MGSNSSANSMVIVAIPEENDRVWKVSSEKIPHLTLLFLGDADKVANPESIVQFVEHATNRSLNRFYLPVSRRDELGEAKADVLLFKKGRYDFRAVRDFRSLLLRDENIKTAYDSTSQFEFPDHVGAAGQPWIPHLTLGYPETPANPMPSEWNEWESNFHSVDFSKIAVWMGDFDGPEFQLKDYWDEMDECGIDMDAPLSVAYSGLEHHGTKGMKWGVRKSESSSGSANSEEKRVVLAGQFALLSPKFREHTSADTKKKVALFGNYSIFSPTVRADLKQASKKVSLDKADSQWDKSLKNGSAWVAVNNKSAEHFNAHIEALNNSPSHPKDRDWSKEDYRNPKDPGFKKYMKDINKLTEDSIQHAAKELDLKNPSGTKEVEIHSDGLPGGFRLTVKHVQHVANDSSLQIKVNYQFDPKGLVTGFTYSDDAETLVQTADLGAEWLEHHGVKGMKWGVRNAGRTTARVGVGAALGATIFPGPIGVGLGVGVAVSSHPSKAERAKKIGPRPGPEDRLPTAKETGKAIGRGAKKVGKGILNIAKDSGFESQGSLDTKRREVASTATRNFNKHDVPRIDAKYKDTKGGALGSRLKNPIHPDTIAYRRESRIAYRDQINAAVKALPGNASKTRKYDIEDSGDVNTQYNWTLKTVAVKNTVAHADTDMWLGDFDVQPIFDEDGFIVDVKAVTEKSMAQTADLGAAWLAHHGVKGMKWGVRRARGTPGFVETQRAVVGNRNRSNRTPIEARVQDTIGIRKRSKTKLIVKGGEDHPATDDAKRVAVSRQKLKKSGIHTLSNKELQDVQTRLNLERNVKQLDKSASTVGKGRQFIKSITGFGKEVNDSINTGAQTKKLIFE